jgi:hypothetical protein
MTMGMHVGATLVAMRNLTAMGLALAAMAAQAAAPVYQVTTNLNLPLDGRGTYLGNGQGVSMNNKGQVLFNKISNVSSKIVFVSEQSPFGYSTTRITTVKVQEVAPAVVTAGSTKVYPRYKGNTNTVGARLFDDGGMLVGVAPQSGKRQQTEYLSDYAPYVLSAGVFTSVPGAYNARAVTANRQGWLLLLSETGVSLGHAGQMQAYAIPQMSTSVLSSAGGAAISSDGRGVVSLGFYNPDDSACFVAFQGQVSKVSTPQAGWRIDCQSINASGGIAGVLHRSTSMGAGEAAVFTWRNGQFQVQPFERDFEPVAMKLLDTGALVLDKGLIYLGGTSVTTAWKGGGQVIRANGEVFDLESIISPALPAGQHFEVTDINDLGQALVRVTGANGSPQKVISPTGL